MKDLKRMFYVESAKSLLLVLIGIMLLFFPEGTIKIVSYTLGSIIAIAGVIGMGKFFYNRDDKRNIYSLAVGIIFIVLACFFFFKTDDIAKVMPFILGCYIVISSAIKFEYTIRLKDMNNDNWKVTLIMNIVSIIFGLLLIFNPFKGAVLITQVIGFIICFYAIIDIIDNYIIKCNVKEVKDILENVEVVIKDEVSKDSTKNKKTNNKRKTTKKRTDKNEKQE